MKKKKRALVLEGGGAKGSYHVGAFRALKERGLNFDYIVGTSIGSINGAMFAQGDGDLAEQLWLDLEMPEILGIDTENKNAGIFEDFGLDKLTQSWDLLKGLASQGGIDTAFMRDLFDKYIDEDKLRKSGVRFGLATVNVSKRETVEIFIDQMPEGSLTDYIMASSYMPVFKLEPINGDYYLDGGFFNPMPISMVKDKADEIIAVGLHTPSIRYGGVSKEDILFIHPEEDLGGSLSFSPENAERNIGLGYRDMNKALDEWIGQGRLVIGGKSGREDNDLIYHKI